MRDSTAVHRASPRRQQSERRECGAVAAFIGFTKKEYGQMKHGKCSIFWT